MAGIAKEQLVKLQKKYKTDEAIGETHGVTRQAIHQLRVKYGIKPLSDKHKERDADVLRMYKNGTVGTAIARKFGLSVSQTYRIIKTAGKKRK